MQLEGDAYVFIVETTELQLAWHPQSYVPHQRTGALPTCYSLQCTYVVQS